MHKEIVAYVDGLSPTDVKTRLVEALCDVTRECSIETLEELEVYIKDNFEKAAKTVRSRDENGPDN